MITSNWNPVPTQSMVTIQNKKEAQVGKTGTYRKIPEKQKQQNTTADTKAK